MCFDVYTSKTELSDMANGFANINSNNNSLNNDMASGFAHSTYNISSATNKNVLLQLLQAQPQLIKTFQTMLINDKMSALPNNLVSSSSSFVSSINSLNKNMNNVYSTSHITNLRSGHEATQIRQRR